MEAAKSERTSILEVLKLSEPEKVRTRLCALLKLNQIPSAQTNAALSAYLSANGDCDPSPASPDLRMFPPAGSASSAAAGSGPASSPSGTVAPPPAQPNWIPASSVIPGCGSSGCYLTYNVCGDVPPNMRPTGNIRSSTDSFVGWGDWDGTPELTEGKVCRRYIQHSHNQTRTVSYQFEVVPKS